MYIEYDKGCTLLHSYMRMLW